VNLKKRCVRTGGIFVLWCCGDGIVALWLWLVVLWLCAIVALWCCAVALCRGVVPLWRCGVVATCGKYGLFAVISYSKHSFHVFNGCSA
jgi:hypothetical protein